MTSSPALSYQDEQTHLLSRTNSLHSTPSSSIPHSNNDTTKTFGAITTAAATAAASGNRHNASGTSTNNDGGDSSLPHYDVVNHGHAYTDALLGGVAIAPSTGATPLSPPLPEEERSKKGVTYWSLIRDNRNFRWFMLSYLVTIAGEWFTYVASISAIEQIHASQNTISRTSISILVALRLLPSALFSNIGGVLADTRDRRLLLLRLDLLGSLVATLFLLSYSLSSLPLLYLSTILQMTVAAIYEPSHSSITPMIVREEPEALKKAMTLGGLSWSVMTSLGSSLGGLAVGWVGIPMCFCLDGVSYLVSAGCIWMIEGSYKAVEAEEGGEDKVDGGGNVSREESLATFFHHGPLEQDGTTQQLLQPRQQFETKREENVPVTNTPRNCCHQFNSMTIQGINYLRSKSWGPFVLLKFCAALIYGAADVLNVSFSERGLDGDNDDPVAMEESSSQRLGILFAFVGIGCFIGPIVADPFTDMDRSESLERMCWISFLSMAVGCYGLSQVESFGWVCVMTSVRSAGSSIVWIDSSLLLQKLASNSMLGRVMAVDYALATLSEAFSAMAGGMLQDDVGMSAEDVSLIMALVGLVTLVVWGIYFTFVRVRD